jgi:hypothetical protein
MPLVSARHPGMELVEGEGERSARPYVRVLRSRFPARAAKTYGNL